MLRYRIVNIPYPIDDAESADIWQALCLTEPSGPEQNVIVAFISPGLPVEILDTDLLIDENHPDFASCGLSGPSAVRFHILTTVPAVAIQKQTGILTPSLQAEVREKITTIFSVGRASHSPCL